MSTKPGADPVDGHAVRRAEPLIEPVRLEDLDEFEHREEGEVRHGDLGVTACVRLGTQAISSMSVDSLRRAAASVAGELDVNQNGTS
jgi:hypothetical protein